MSPRGVRRNAGPSPRLIGPGWTVRLPTAIRYALTDYAGCSNRPGGDDRRHVLPHEEADHKIRLYRLENRSKLADAGEQAKAVVETMDAHMVRRRPALVLAIKQNEMAFPR